MALIESLTPKFHQDLIDGEISERQPHEIASAARKKYGSMVQERISDEVQGKYVLAGHVQQLVQKLQRSPFFGIIVPVCASLQSKAVHRETYERDVAPFMNSTQRKDFAVYMKRVRESQALHAATVEQARQTLQGKKAVLVVSSCLARCLCLWSLSSCSITAGKNVSKRVSNHANLAHSIVKPCCSDCRHSAGYLSQRELFDVLVSAKVSAVEAKALILALDPLVRHNVWMLSCILILFAMLLFMPQFRFYFFDEGDLI